MSKHESPPFRMKVEGGRLVPASAWDAERLDTYRKGSLLSVHITQQKNRKLERKYWAILHKVIERCPVQQRTAEDLHRAIKLKLGVVDAFFTIDGKLRVDVKSTASMEEPEYRLFFEEAMALLHKVTGVDPLTLGAEAADVGDDEPEQETASSPTAAADGDAGSGEEAGTDAESPAADQAGEEPATAGIDGMEARAEPVAPSVPADEKAMVNPKGMNTEALKAEMVKKIVELAGNKDWTAQDRLAELDLLKSDWTARMPGFAGLVDQVFKTAAKIVRGELSPAKAKQYLDGLPVKGGA